jgi:glutathione reductase (NADPH)
VAEEFRVGGTCVIRGCVPKKFMVYASEVTSQLKTAEGYGWTVEGQLRLAEIPADKDVEIARLSGIYATNLRQGWRRPGARPRPEGRPHRRDLPKGAARRRRSPANKILIATGGRPGAPRVAGRRARASPRTRPSICRSCPRAS